MKNTRHHVMNIKETIKNIRASCNNYVDPDLFAFIIDEDFHMGTNNISEIEGYGMKLTQEEFDENADEEEKLFGILIKNNSNDYIIGKTDVCNCSIDASFEKIEKSESEFYEKIEKIISEKII